MRLILADHQPRKLLALEMLLEEKPEFDVIGDAEDAQGLLALSKKHSPDLVLMDASLPGMPVEELIRSLHALEPRPIVMAISSEFEDSKKLLKAGVDTFVSISNEPDWLLDKLYKYVR